MSSMPARGTLAGLTVAVFGLGEAGSEIAAGLAAAGALVRGYDPAEVGDVVGVVAHFLEDLPGVLSQGRDVASPIRR